MWKDSIRNIVVIFQPNILRIVGFYVRHSATDSYFLYVSKIEYGWNLWLKVLFIMCTYITKNFIEIPPCAKKVIFSTEFVLLDLNPPFYEVNQEVWKRPCAWRNFKNIFCVLSTPHKKPFRTEKTSIFNFRYVKEVWASVLLGVKHARVFLYSQYKRTVPLLICTGFLKYPFGHLFQTEIKIQL